MTATRWLPALALVVVAGCGSTILSPPQPSQSSTAEVRTFGFIPRVDPEARTISFDRAEWLTGTEAQRAAEAAGAVETGESVPNDFFIRNPDKRVVVLRVAPRAVVSAAEPVSALARSRCGHSTRCGETFPITVDEFFAAWSGDGLGADGKYWVAIRDGVVVAIDEQYTP